MNPGAVPIKTCKDDRTFNFANRRGLNHRTRSDGRESKEKKCADNFFFNGISPIQEDKQARNVPITTIEKYSA